LKDKIKRIEMKDNEMRIESILCSSKKTVNEVINNYENLIGLLSGRVIELEKELNEKNIIIANKLHEKEK